MKFTVKSEHPGKIKAGCVILGVFEKRRLSPAAIEFDKVGAFTFSPEPGTPSATLPDPVPDEVKDDPKLHSSCVAGAAMVDDLQAMLEAAAFHEVRITPKDESREFIRDWAPGKPVTDFVVASTIEAIKPAGAAGERVGMRIPPFRLLHLPGKPAGGPWSFIRISCKTYSPAGQASRWMSCLLYSRACSKNHNSVQIMNPRLIVPH